MDARYVNSCLDLTSLLRNGPWSQEHTPNIYVLLSQKNKRIGNSPSARYNFVRKVCKFYTEWTIPQLDKLLNSKTILAQLEKAS